MNYCQFRNDFIKRMANAGGGGLPSEYQRVEYLEGSGTQYIDTGITSYSSEWEYSGKAYATTTDAIFLSFRNFSYDTNTLGIYCTKGNFLLHISNGCRVSGIASPCEFTIGAKKITYNGTTNTYTNARTYTVNYQLLLFKASNVSSQLFVGKVYYFTVQNGTEKILDFVPCYRKSDNKPGMYDLVTRTFFTNAGTGEFTVGNNV